MKKFAVLMAFTVAGLSFAADIIQPTRVGPVSQYGQLQAGKNSSGKGQIYGACKGVSDGNEVVIQGMSLFWSTAGINYDLNEGYPYWTAAYVNQLVSRHNIQLIRAPMGVDEEWSGAPHYFSSNENQQFQQGLMDAVVEAAIKNDIYVIIDYHSHRANENVENAKTFFNRMAKKWGSYDNVIFEIFNEPKEQSWSTIKSYADSVIKVIRDAGSDNLIVVGNPSWSSRPDEAKGSNNKINDDNVAYTFHFYAGVDYTDKGEIKHETYNEGSHAVAAMNGGLSVFVTEWGASGPSGGGSFSSTRTKNWYDWMKTHKLSGANWAVSSKAEAASYFDGNVTATGTWNHTDGGNWVNSNIFANLPAADRYTVCSTTPSSSNSVPSSSASSTVTLIDDFLDGNVTAETLEDGGWFLYEADGSISNTKKANGDWDMIRSSGSSKYASMEGISLVPTTDEPYPSVGMGLALVEGAFTNCSAIQYDYKGSGHFFRADISTVTPKKGYEHQTEEQESSTSWKTVTVTADDLDQPFWVYQDSALAKEIKPFDWSKVYQLVWFVSMDIQSQGTSLQIDNVKCLGTLPEVVVVSSSSVASSSASSSPSSAGSSSASVASSTSIASSASITSSAAVASSLIDDFEDGDNMAFTGLNDFWYAFTDKGDNGASTISNSKNEEGDYVVVFGSAAADGSKYGAGLKNIALSKGGNAYDPYVTLGVNLEDGLAGCTQISYKYKGAGHNLKAVTLGDEDGLLSGYNYHKTDFKGSSDWAVASVSVPDGLKQEKGWGTNLGDLKMADIVKLQWEVKKTATHAYLYIDDVKCAGMTIVPFSSSSATVLSSASVGPVSSSSVQQQEMSSSSESQMHVQTASASAGLFATVRGNTLQVRIANPGLVKVQVFDMMGHVIETHSENMTAGSFAHTFGSMGKGAYIVRVQQGSMVRTIRMQVR
jgi:hypothetical protein